MESEDKPSLARLFGNFFIKAAFLILFFNGIIWFDGFFGAGIFAGRNALFLGVNSFSMILFVSIVGLGFLIVSFVKDDVKIFGRAIQILFLILYVLSIVFGLILPRVIAVM
jgi:hypothetical protein